jgi:hypothetical protein
MKRNIKKLAVFVIVASITMFIAAGMASADLSFHKAIRGQFAATTEATCMIAPFGFNPNLTPINGVGVISMQNRQSIFTFEKNGTGSVTANGSVIQLSYIGPNGPVPPSSASQTISFDFTYTVDDGMITITQVPKTYFVTFTSGPNNGLTYQVEGASIKGTITPDGKNIILNTNASDLFTLIGPNLPPIGLNHSCSGSSVLIWQHDEKP